jgi:hypothetical protein
MHAKCRKTYFATCVCVCGTLLSFCRWTREWSHSRRGALPPSLPPSLSLLSLLSRDGRGGGGGDGSHHIAVDAFFENSQLRKTLSSRDVSLAHSCARALSSRSRRRLLATPRRPPRGHRLLRRRRRARGRSRRCRRRRRRPVTSSYRSRRRGRLALSLLYSLPLPLPPSLSLFYICFSRASISRPLLSSSHSSAMCELMCGEPPIYCIYMCGYIIYIYI